MAPPPGAMHLGPAGSGQYPPIVPQGMYVQPGTAGGQREHRSGETTECALIRLPFLASFHPQQNLTRESLVTTIRRVFG